MKVFSIIIVIIGALFLIVGVIFKLSDWPDLWNGLVSGPIIVTVGIILFIFQKKAKE